MAGHPDRDEQGRFEPTVTSEAILQTFRHGRPFHTAGEIADRFGIDRSTAYRRLQSLSESDRLEKVPLGHRTVVWWYPADRYDAPDDRDTSEPLLSAPVLESEDAVAETDHDSILYGPAGS